MGITTPSLDLSWIKPAGPIAIGLLNVTDNSLLVGTFIALLTGSVMVTVGEVTLNVNVLTVLIPVLVWSKIQLSGKFRVYVPGAKLAVGVMVKTFPLINLFIDIVPLIPDKLIRPYLDPVFIFRLNVIVIG
jgi:hypothetical protein